MEEEEEIVIPLEDQRVFGAGIRKQRVNFIPATTGDDAQTSQQTVDDAQVKQVKDQYLSIVFRGRDQETTQHDRQAQSARTDPEKSPNEDHADPLCEVCNLPVRDHDGIVPSRNPHEASIAHQVCLAHSHPPSHLDRSRTGLKYLSSYGWDPDNRVGLGATGQGIRIPIKGKSKNDTAGLGMGVLEGKKRAVLERRIEKLDAKKVRKQEEGAKKKRERLQELFYGSDDVEKYLRST